MHESQTPEYRICGVGDGESVRSTRVITSTAYEIIPGLAVAIECAVTIPVKVMLSPPRSQAVDWDWDWDW